MYFFPARDIRVLSSVFLIFTSLALASKTSTTSTDKENLGSLLPNTHTELVSHTPIARRTTSTCANAIENPSFEANTIDPWNVYVTGSWATRDVVEGVACSGSRFYHALSNSTNASTITLSQPFSLPTSAGTMMECSAWTWMGGDMGSGGTARFEIFLDGVSCGGTVLDGGGGWVKVGGEIQVDGGDEHSMVVVAVVDAYGEMGTKIETGIDGIWVGRSC